MYKNWPKNRLKIIKNSVKIWQNGLKMPKLDKNWQKNVEKWLKLTYNIKKNR